MDLLESDGSFILDFFKDQLSYIEDTILSNNIKDVTEEISLSNSIKRILKITRKEQLNELSGQYKLIKKFEQMLKNIKDKYADATRIYEEAE